jgi:hypothetical protein
MRMRGRIFPEALRAHTHDATSNHLGDITVYLPGQFLSCPCRKVWRHETGRMLTGIQIELDVIRDVQYAVFYFRRGLVLQRRQLVS